MMILDDLRQGSPAPEHGCTRLESPLPDVKVNGEVESKILGRKRMGLRRVRLDESNEDLLFCENDLKKLRSEVRKTQAEDALLVRLPEISAGGGRSGEETTRDNHGSISVIGRRREMEDAVAVKSGFLTRGGKSYDFFGVYDGHGGRCVAEACSQMLHKLLVSVVEEGRTGGEEIDWRKAMATGFKIMDEEVSKIGAEVATVGSTAVVAVVGEDEVVVANCGDSRAVLCRGGVAIQLSDDHKPDRADELQRIELSGGRVINWNGQRVLGVLATSRSIGDEYLKPYVTSEPEVTITSRSNKDEFLILASDGLWDVIPNDVACQVVRRCLDGRIKSRHRKGSEENNGKLTAKAAAMLGELAMARGSKDNISVVVVGLNFEGKKQQQQQ